ncbi:hypothetical protein [Candidatus Phaeomarinobacter ectocarpi]|nr:hypothetical protein [Candidatus Phaeomarinobacter ectocarpi]
MRLVIAGSALCLSLIAPKTAAAANCSEPELLEDHHEEYNKLICDGVRDVQEHDYSRAVDSFENALAIRLHEQPNFQLFPKLAWASFKAGQTEKAEVALEKARLSLSVFTGILKCEEHEDGYQLMNPHGEPVTERLSDQVTLVMCGAAYDYVYQRQSLERVLEEAAMVERYLDVKHRIADVNASE